MESIYVRPRVTLVANHAGLVIWGCVSLLVPSIGEPIPRFLSAVSRLSEFRKPQATR